MRLGRFAFQALGFAPIGAGLRSPISLYRSCFASTRSASRIGRHSLPLGGMAEREGWTRLFHSLGAAPRQSTKRLAPFRFASQTLGTLVRYDDLANRCFRPLSHLSCAYRNEPSTCTAAVLLTSANFLLLVCCSRLEPKTNFDR